MTCAASPEPDETDSDPNKVKRTLDRIAQGFVEREKDPFLLVQWKVAVMNELKE